VTGLQDRPALHHRETIAELARLGAPPPIVGFGIATPDQVREAMSAGAAGVISGSAIAELVTQPDASARITNFVAAMKEATGSSCYAESAEGDRNHAR